MDLQKLFLRFMLISLALTALIGVAVVLFDLERFGLRAVGTALATTVATGILARLSGLYRRDSTRFAGSVGMGIVVAAYIIILPLIWWNPDHGAASEIHSAFAQTSAWLLFVGIFVLLSLLMWQVPQLFLTARVGLAISGIIFLELMLGTWLPSTHAPQQTLRLGREAWLLASLASALFGILVGACLPRLRQIPWNSVGLLAALVGWAIATYAAFAETSTQSGKTILTLATSVAGLAAYRNFIHFLQIAPGNEWVRITGYASALVTTVGVDVLIIQDIWSLQSQIWNDWIGRATAAAAIVTACDTVGLIVLAVIHRYTESSSRADSQADTPPDVSSTHTTIHVTCPRCNTNQTLAVGRSTCSHCGLKFTIHIWE